MPQRRKRAPRRLLGALLLLLLLAALLPLGAFLAGLLPGGGRLPSARDAGAARDAAGTLEITVLRAEDRAPVEGARILVDGSGETALESDAAGKARLGGIGSGPVRIETTVEGRRAVAWADPGTDRSVLLAVAPERMRRGTVRTDDGAPVAKAGVALLDAFGRPLERGTTDAHGRYELPHRPDAVAVCATDGRHAPACAPDGDLTMEDGVRVEGTLAGASGGDLLVYGRLPAPQDDAMLPLHAVWTVGPDGAFSGRLPRGADAWAVYDGRPVRLGPGTVPLPERIDVAGRVTCAGGAPAARAMLRLTPLLDGGLPAPLPPLRAECDETGAFRVEALPAVPYAVEVTAPGCATRQFPEVEFGTEPLHFELEPGFGLEGSVLDTAGLPVAGARVQAVGLPQAPERPVAETHADEDGAFRVSGLGGARARVRVTAPGCFPTTLEQVAPDRALRITLQRRGTGPAGSGRDATSR